MPVVLENCYLFCSWNIHENQTPIFQVKKNWGNLGNFKIKYLSPDSQHNVFATEQLFFFDVLLQVQSSFIKQILILFYLQAD